MNINKHEPAKNWDGKSLVSASNEKNLFRYSASHEVLRVSQISRTGRRANDIKILKTVAVDIASLISGEESFGVLMKFVTALKDLKEKGNPQLSAPENMKQPAMKKPPADARHLDLSRIPARKIEREAEAKDDFMDDFRIENIL
jgi:hypothetical protein